MIVRMKRPYSMNSLKYKILRLFNKNYEVSKQKHKIIIEDHDIWDASYTMAHIILPILKKYKKDANGFPYIDEIKTFEDWENILDSMIWSFENILDDSWEDQFYKDKEGDGFFGNFEVDLKGLEKHNEKIQKGLDLFSKYFVSLWT